MNTVSTRQKGHLGADGGGGEESQGLWGTSMGQKRCPVMGGLEVKMGELTPGVTWRSAWGRGGTRDSRGQKRGEEVEGEGGTRTLGVK